MSQEGQDSTAPDSEERVVEESTVMDAVKMKKLVLWIKQLGSHWERAVSE